MTGRSTWVWRGGRLVPKTPAAMPAAPSVMTDSYHVNPVVSPVDHTLIASRADLREHNRRNGVVDVGNDPAFRRPPAPASDAARMRDVQRDIVRAIETLNG